MLSSYTRAIVNGIYMYVQWLWLFWLITGFVEWRLSVNGMERCGLKHYWLYKLMDDHSIQCSGCSLGMAIETLVAIWWITQQVFICHQAVLPHHVLKLRDGWFDWQQMLKAATAPTHCPESRGEAGHLQHWSFHLDQISAYTVNDTDITINLAH
jgi:hypothetical protein